MSSELIIKFIVKLGLAIICNVIIVFLYYFNDKKKSIKEKSSKYCLIFLFGIWYVVFDLVKRLFSKHDEINKNVIKITCIAIAAFLVLDVAIPRIAFPDLYSSPFSQTYYDKYGNSYDSLEEVIYYTEDNCQYTFDEDNLMFICKNKPDDSQYKDSYKVGYAYVDHAGYLVLTEYVLNLVENGDFDWYDSSTDDYYMDAEFARWNQQGTLSHR
ncbi:MAG: hypothetical protein NC397_08220 [Clostridium sp.]|nr:hypothetical protein [Clostridium sp.]